MTTPLPPALLAIDAFTLADAARWGVGPDAIRAAVRSGGLRRVTRGWYTSGSMGSPEQEHLLRAVAAHRATGLPLGGVSALVQHGLPVFDLERRPVQLVGPPERRRVRGGVTITPPLAGGARLAPGDVAVDVDDALVSAALVDPELALAAADHAVRAGRTTTTRLSARLPDVGSRRGSVGARTALSLVDGRRESVGESRLAWCAHGWGLVLRPQVVVRTDAGTFRADFEVEGSRTLLEFDGMLEYADRADLVAEKRREDALRRAGYTVLRVTWGDLYRPDVLRRRLLDATVRRVA